MCGVWWGVIMMMMVVVVVVIGGKVVDRRVGGWLNVKGLGWGIESHVV